MRQIKLAISSAFERTLIYRILSYRIVSYRIIYVERIQCNVTYDCFST